LSFKLFIYLFFQFFDIQKLTTFFLELRKIVALKLGGKKNIFPKKIPNFLALQVTNFVEKKSEA
jgi:hypothetical protein